MISKLVKVKNFIECQQFDSQHCKESQVLPLQVPAYASNFFLKTRVRLFMFVFTDFLLVCQSTYFVCFQLLDVAATDLLNKSTGSPSATPLHLVVSCALQWLEQYE